MLKPPQVNISFENNRRIYSGGAELNPNFNVGLPTSVFVHNNLMRGGVQSSVVVSN
jgi:hypothetical protein